jgi:putative tricarboxylic transport membrane protein
VERASGPGLETAFDVVLLVLGCAVAYTSWGYGFGSLSLPGPGLYPLFLGVAIAVFAVWMLAAHVRTPPQHEPLDSAGRKTLLLMSVTFCLWIIAMPLLGYVAVTLIATYAFCKAMKLEGWRKPAAVSIGTALFTYLLFDVWLYIDLPRGIFE